MRTASTATQAALRESMAELAEYKRSQGLTRGTSEPEPEQEGDAQSVSTLMRTASPATQAALQQSMRELAEAKRAAGFTDHSTSPRERPAQTEVADEGATLKRQFSTEMYDKMLRNPKLSAEQRAKIEAMRARRQAKESTNTTTTTVRPSAAVHTCMRSSLWQMWTCNELTVSYVRRPRVMVLSLSLPPSLSPPLSSGGRCCRRQEMVVRL